MCVEITSRWYVDYIIKVEKTIGVHKLSTIYKDVFYKNLVIRKSQNNVSVQSVQINNCNCTSKRKEENSCLYRDCKLFLSKDRFEVVRVDYGIASIPFFWVDVYHLVRVSGLVPR